MNQLERNSRRNAPAGRSRGKGSAHRPSSRGRGTSGGTRSSSYRSAQSGRTGGAHNTRRGGSHHRRKGPDYKLIAMGGVILLVVILCVALALQSGKEQGEESVSAETETTEAQIQQEVMVDGISITGMSKNQARNALLQAYPWSMTVAYGEDTYEVEDLVSARIDILLDEIYSGQPEESYSLTMDGLEEYAAEAAAACASRWNKKAKNGSIDSFDKESNQFVFAGEENGFAIDEEKLAADILAAVENKEFDARLEASGSTVAPEITKASAKEKYKTISTFTTKTTANKNRNTNVRLSAEAINGTVIGPGEEFSFNGVVGQRTEAKGYKGAAAYNNGEVVQEIGGGVCQVSTTLYNAVFRAGLEITYRRSHTFEPNYVTPGQDATVSWEQPDFKFRNTSSTAIGLKASYADQKVTVSVYGIPILEEGVKWDLESKKVEELDPPAPVYEEDQTLEPGVEVQKSAGSKGSRWETYKVVYKDGVEVSRERDHKTTYKGHAPVIRRNTSGVVLTPEETTTSAETPVPTIDGMPDGYVPDASQASPGESSSSSAGTVVVPGGPGTETAAPSTEGPAQEASSEAPSAAETVSPGPGGANPVIDPLKAGA